MNLEERTALLHLLKMLEWSGIRSFSSDGIERGMCPACGEREPWEGRANKTGGGHQEDCAMAKMILVLGGEPDKGWWDK